MKNYNYRQVKVGFWLLLGLIGWLPCKGTVAQVFTSVNPSSSGWYNTWANWVWAPAGSLWVSHETHGWLLVSGASPNHVWFWDEEMQCWLWSNQYYYPNLYSASNDEWFYYITSSDNPRAFWSHNRNAYEYDLYYDVPSYVPSYWNSNYLIRGTNNCYNYACNVRTDTFAQPGKGSGTQYSSITVSEIYDAAIRDGLEDADATGPVPQGKSRIAIVVAPGYDYHCYRQDDNGKWSHKPGSTAARNFDASGHEIFNIELADWGLYTQFVGYFFVDSDDDQGEGTENIY